MGKYIPTNDGVKPKVKKNIALKKKKKDSVKSLVNKVDLIENQELGDVANVKKVTKTYSYNTEGVISNVRNDEVLTIETCESESFFNQSLVNYEDLTSKDLYFQIIDEISLEGLDGITLEALWKRLDISLENTVYFEFYIQSLIWKLLCSNNNVAFYVMEEPRQDLIIYDRYDYVSKEDGICLELEDDLIPDIYPYEMVNDQGIRGSCKTYATRKKIENRDELSLEEAIGKYGNKLVIVADTETRKKAIMFEGSDPIAELNDIEYGILERIARARYCGEITRGNISLQSLIADSKTLHHYQNNFLRYDLIRKQVFYLRNVVLDKIRQGRLLHLTRFYREHKTKTLKIAEQVINLIKKKPNYFIEYSELRNYFSYNFPSAIKVIKSDEFRNHVQTDLFIPYRAIYPDATVGQWRCGSKNKERLIRVMKLKDPCVNISALWRKNDDNEEYDENDEPQSDFDAGHKSVNKDCCTEVYNKIISYGNEGLTSMELEALCEIDHNAMRLILRRLLGKKCVFTKKQDIGKQRSLKYMAAIFQDNPNLKFEPPIPPTKDRTVIEEILARQQNAIKKAPKTQIYTVEQAELDKMMIAETGPELPIILDLEHVEIKCKELRKQTGKISDKTDIPMDVELKAKFMQQGKFYQAKITFKQYVMMNKPHINDIIKENKLITSLSLNIPPNIKTHILEFHKFDNVTKILLIKLMLGEIVKRHPLDFYLTCLQESIETKKNLKHIIAKKSEDIVVETPKKIVSGPVKTFNPAKHRVDQIPPPIFSNYGNDKVPKLPVNYMGNNPVVIVDETDEKGVRVVVEMSTPPKSFMLENSQYISKMEETTRVLSRIKIILDAIKKSGIVEDSHKLSKTIEAIEKEEGYDKKIDRKSVFRLFKKLIDEGYAKMYRLLIWDENTTKYQTFLCDIDIPASHSAIKTCQEQMKLRFFMGVSKKRTALAADLSPPAPPPKKRSIEPAFRAEDVKESISQLNSISEKNILNDNLYKHDRLIGRQYGFKPKYVRMQILHEFLNYLVYFFEGKDRLDDKEVEELFRSNKIEMTVGDLESLPPMYAKEISWRSFIKVLPNHKGWSTGWALVADVVLRLPLSILVKLHNITFSDPELIELLQHPVRRHFLISTLSEKAKRVLFYKRKYLRSIHDILCQLAFLGLLQFGPQKQKEKDQVFVYINKKASILDTTTSEPGYHKVTEKEYTKITFTFTTQEDIDAYWYELWNICMNTKLGARNVMAGKNVTYLDVSIKQELTICLKPQTNEEVRKLDTGDIPGDRRGAGGLDSILWSHIARNWQWFTSNKKAADRSTELTLLKREKFDKTLTYPVPFSQLKQPCKIHSRPKTLYPAQPKVTNHLCFRTTKRKPKICRKMPVKSKMKKCLTDNLDKRLLKKLGKIRVSWDAQELSFLYVNKALLLLLCPKYPSKNYIPFTVQRDVLHLCLPKSRSKSSEAVKRKMRILHRDDATYRSLDLNFMHLMKIKPLEKYLKYMVYDLTKNGLQNFTEKEIQCAYLVAMCYLTKHTEEVKSLLLGASSTNFQHNNESTLQENAEDFVYVNEDDEGYKGYKEPDNEEEIQKEVVKSIIHSNLGCEGDHAAWAYQLFKTYQNYPDNVLHNAVEELKDQQFVTMKPSPHKTKSKKKKNWTNPVQLSSYYIFQQACTYGAQTALEAYKSFINARTREQKLDFTLAASMAKKYGRMLCYNEVFTFWDRYGLEFNIPEYSLILDPNIEDHSELVEELAIRHQIKIRRMIENQNSRLVKPTTSLTTDDPDQESDPENSEPPSKKMTPQPSTSTSTHQTQPTNNQQKTNAEPNSNENPAENENEDNSKEPNLDLEAVDEEDAEIETIDNLKSWVSKCLTADVERRSPSPEFFDKHAEKEKESTAKKLQENAKEQSSEQAVLTIESGGVVEGSGNSVGGRDDVAVEERDDDVDDNFDNFEEEVFVENGKEVPSLEEIKKAIIEEGTPNTTGNLPNIGDLSNLLTKEAFPERDTDEETLERLKRHFVSQFPEIVDITINDLEEYVSASDASAIFDRDKYLNFWKEIKRKAYVHEPETENLLNEVEIIGGDSIDFALIDELSDFIKSKSFMGAEAIDIKNGFQNYHTLPIDAMLKFLLDHHIVMQTGICNLKFVHSDFKNHWVIDSFKLTDQDEALIEKNKDRLKDVKEEIESQLKPIDKRKVHIMPWIKVNGTYNVQVFRMWLCCVQSYVMEHPKTLLTLIFEKYSYVRPVDLYYLIEILQELDCLELRCYEEIEINLFTDLTIPMNYRKATILDDFENVFVIPSTMSMSRLGAFLDVMEE